MNTKRVSIPVPWTPEQDQALRDLWPTNERIKAHLDLFGEHTYGAIMQRANQELKLGKRPNCPRGQAPIAWTLIERQLKVGPANCYRLADLLNLHQATTLKQLGEKHCAGLVHIHDWDRPSGKKPVPVYALGTGVDKPSPALKGAAKEKKYRQARLHKRVIEGETVRVINPFAAAAGLVEIPQGKTGRRYVQDMTGERMEKAA